MTAMEKKFLAAMKDIYIKADKECGYRPTRFLQMLADSGGVATAKSLVSKPGGTEGFSKLWELGRLDLSVEALVMREDFRELFPQGVLDTCRSRLLEYGFKLPG